MKLEMKNLLSLTSSEKHLTESMNQGEERTSGLEDRVGTRSFNTKKMTNISKTP